MHSMRRIVVFQEDRALAGCSSTATKDFDSPSPPGRRNFSGGGGGGQGRFDPQPHIAPRRFVPRGGSPDEKTEPSAALRRQLQAAKNAGVEPFEPAKRDGHSPRLKRLLQPRVSRCRECSCAASGCGTPWFSRLLSRGNEPAAFPGAPESNVSGRSPRPPPREGKTSFRRRSRSVRDHCREPARRRAGPADRPSPTRPAIRPASPRRKPASGNRRSKASMPVETAFPENSVTGEGEPGLSW